MLKGLPIERYSVEQAAVIFYGLGIHVGQPRMQNANGHLLGHVRDLSVNSNEHGVRIYQTNERQTFHTDSCDIVGLLCLRKAKQGGESLLVSALAIYNEMLSARPDLVRCCLIRFQQIVEAKFPRAWHRIFLYQCLVGTKNT